jgi:ribonuclease Z
LARDVDLLIHEATFLPDDADHARRTQHSTTDDAAGVARKAAARHLALTHFSTRYMGDLRPLIQAAEAAWPAVICARDFMHLQLRVGEVPVVGDSRNMVAATAPEAPVRDGV